MKPRVSSWAPVANRRLFCLVYCCGRMRRRFPVLLWLLLTAGAAGAVENSFQAFTIIRAEEKTHDRVVYWVVNTPLYHEDPYFEVEVEAGDAILVGEYEPRHTAEMLPQSWKPGAVVRGRVESRNLYLRRPNGTDLKFVIVKRKHAPPER
jgi:hypothetical protein